MPLNDFLSIYYGVQVDENIEMNRKDGFRSGNYFYFITSVDNREIVFMEQTSLAYFLKENRYDQIALPIPNLQGEWVTSYHDKNYMVMQVTNMQEENKKTDGLKLAEFHWMGTGYQYQPNRISSYGKWNSLWMEKLDYVEARVKEEAIKNPSPYYQYIMDVFPYIIGISENAIQYARESEAESRFHEADQGTITFHRYINQLNEPVLWIDDLVYDHPTRDIAEYIRNSILKGESQDKIKTFLNDYQSIRPLSIFSLRLIYARLLFPTHMLDVIYRGFIDENQEVVFHDISKLFDTQSYYHEVLRDFYMDLGINTRSLEIPELDWL